MKSLRKKKRCQISIGDISFSFSSISLPLVLEFLLSGSDWHDVLGYHTLRTGGVVGPIGYRTDYSGTVVSGCFDKGRSGGSC